jgi:hypothetical protein
LLASLVVCPQVRAVRKGFEENPARGKPEPESGIPVEARRRSSERNEERESENDSPVIGRLNLKSVAFVR